MYTRSWADKGYVRIQVTGETTERDLSIRFDIEDTGIGIQLQEQNRIFDLFTQVNTKRDRKQTGIGLGLSITKQLAALFGGTLTVKSNPGEGSTFSLVIPVRNLDFVEGSSTATTAKEYALPELLTFEGKVLLVDDYPAIRKQFKALLERFGLTVTLAENGQEAVDFAQNNSFDLVLMDVQMLVYDGCAATIEIKKRGIKTPIVATTAYASDEDLQEFQDVGFDDCFAKPIAQEDLVAIFKKYMTA